MRRFLRDNSLSVVLFGLFFLTYLGGQAVAGHQAFNADQEDHGEPTVSFPST